MTAKSDDLTEGWPNEPGGEQLARFAGKLRGMLPALPDAALGRVEARVRREVAARRRRRVGVIAAGLAAGLLLTAALGWRFLRPPIAPPTPPPAPAVAGRVDDRFSTPFAGPQAAAAPEGPILRIQDNQSLFTH